MPTSGPQNLGNVSFQEPERAWRSPPPHSQNDPRRNPRQASSQRADDRPRAPTTDAWTNYSPSGFVRSEDPERSGRPSKTAMDPEAAANMFSGTEFTRKKSLIRPDREKIEPGHRQWHYRNHAAGLDEEDEGARVGVIPSTTGNFPQTGLHRGRSLLARDEDVHESGLALFKRGGATLRRKRIIPTGPTPSNSAGPGTDLTPPKRGLFKNIAPGPVDAWMIYCWFLTICIPPFLLQSCGEYPTLPDIFFMSSDFPSLKA
jgi:chitin synthase